MIRDITFGQYIPAASLIHRMDARVKFVLLLLLMVDLLAFCDTYWALAAGTVFTVLLVGLTRVPLKLYGKNVKVILPVLLFTALLNALYTTGGRELWRFWVFCVTTAGINRALFMAIRLILLIVLSAALTYTVTPNDLTDALERLCTPLKWIGLGKAVHILAMMMTIALRFIPILIEETDKIMNAQRSRGANLDEGGLMKRIKALIPILIPLFVSSIRRSYDLAEAMESRCYNGGEGRQRMKQMKLCLRDYGAIGVTVAFSVGMALTKFLLEGNL